MRILQLVDFLDNWSIHNRAKAIAKFCPEHEFTIRGANEGESVVADIAKFHVAHFQFSAQLTNFADLIWKRRHRTVLTVSNERSYFNDHEVDGPEFRRLINQCPYVTSVSRRVADAANCAWIPNGIDAEIFSKPKSPVVGTAGTGSFIKGEYEIRRACADLGVEVRSAKYNRKRGDHSFSHAEMQDFYRGLDVYVHASKTEGFNNTIVEALACNCPVIMSRAGCWREFRGWVDFCDPSIEGIKTALQKFLGRRLIVNRFLWKNIVPDYVRFYEDIYANHCRAREVSPDPAQVP